jgi:ABC-type phosphate transport system substrate-binding protein
MRRSPTLQATHEPPGGARRRLLRLALLVVLACSVTPAAASTDAYQVVVHPANSASTLERGFVMDAFLKKTSRWPDGAVIAPVDQRPDSPTRKAFSQGVLKRSVAAVRSYWTQRIFAGRDIPPPEVDSDARVVHFVASHPGAIGYVAVGTDIKGVKAIAIH